MTTENSEKNLATITDGTQAVSPVSEQMALLEAQTEYARRLADSDMIPKHYQKKPANALVAMKYGEELGVSPLVAMSQIVIVNGGVSMEAKLMITLARKAGHLIYLDGDDEQATCTLIRADDPQKRENIVTWTKAKAQKAGLWGKGHWEKNPGLMLKYRAASENIRLNASEVLAGISYTPEEMEERENLASRVITVKQVQPPAEAKPSKTATEYMRALHLNGRQFKVFTERVLGGAVSTWETLTSEQQDKVLAQLAVWEATGEDPTAIEVETVDVETGEIVGER